MSFFDRIAQDFIQQNGLTEADFIGDLSGGLGAFNPTGVVLPETGRILPILPTVPVVPVQTLPVPTGALPVSPTPTIPLPVVVIDREETSETVTGTEIINFPTIAPLLPLSLPVATAAAQTETQVAQNAVLGIASQPQSSGQNTLIPIALVALAAIVLISKR